MLPQDYRYHPSSTYNGHHDRDRDYPPRPPRDRDDYKTNGSSRPPRDRDDYRYNGEARYDSRGNHSVRDRQDRYEKDSSRDRKSHGDRSHTSSSERSSNYSGRQYKVAKEGSRPRGGQEKKMSEIALHTPVFTPSDEDNKRRVPPQNKEKETTELHPTKRFRSLDGESKLYGEPQDEENSSPNSYLSLPKATVNYPQPKMQERPPAMQQLDEHLQRAQQEFAQLFARKNTEQRVLERPIPSSSKPEGIPFNYGASPSESNSEDEVEYSLFTKGTDTKALLRQLEEESVQFSASYKNEAFEALKSCKIQQRPTSFLASNGINCKKLGAGSFHHAFKVNGQSMVYRFPKPELDTMNDRCTLYHMTTGGRITVPYTASILYNGYLSYKALETVVQDMPGVRVARLYNNPVKDGYWQVEYVANDVDIYNLDQLKKVGSCLKKMIDENKVVFPDFRPSNVKVDIDGSIVIIDFCEDKTIDHFRMVTTRQLVEEYIMEWAQGNNRVLNALKSYAGI